jgi:acyl-coenzyme A synthetase/AMP-(fatty) acid ligase
MNIVDPILFHCQRQAPAAAICAPGSRIGLISYRRLENAIHNIGRRVHAFGLSKGSVVAVEVADAIFHIAILLSLTRLGMTTISISEEDFSFPIRTDALITTNKRRSADFPQAILADWDWIEGDSGPLETHRIPITHEEDPCRVVLTRAAHGKRRSVLLSHKLIANRLAHQTIFSGRRIADCSRIYADLPLTSELGFQVLLYVLRRGGTAFFPGDSFERTLRSFEDHKVQCLVSSSEGLENLVRWFDVVAGYQTKIEAVLCTEGILSKVLSDEVRSRICSHLVSAYGGAETGVFAVANAQEIADSPGAVGFVTPNATVEINDASGKIVPAGQEGYLRVRSDVTAGYFETPDDSSNGFRDGWFHSGAKGMLSPDNLVTIRNS